MRRHLPASPVSRLLVGVAAALALGTASVPSAAAAERGDRKAHASKRDKAQRVPERRAAKADEKTAGGEAGRKIG